MEYLKQNKNSLTLKIAIFATGFAGIVAEYILSTLATYFIGNSVFQWTMIVSLMLFFMGIGSRLSKYIKTELITKFLYLEIALSVTVSFSSILVYTSAAVSELYPILIYGLCIFIGLLIGLEIPLVIRINKEYEDFKTNISSVLENDYYGSLLGGVFFAFIGLPILGLTYTPFVLGFVNLGVALLVARLMFSKLSRPEKRKVSLCIVGSLVVLVVGLVNTQTIIQWGEQTKYQDKVVHSEQSAYQKIVLTEWKNDHWLYLNGNLQFCSMDEVMYHEPLVHPIMHLAQHPQNILILGGGDGCAVRELLKYETIKTIDLVDLDPAMTDLGKNHPILKAINQNAMWSDKLTVTNADAYVYLEKDTEHFYDVIIIDLPDPRSVELSRLYSQEFYSICKRKLRPNGFIITQAGSPYFATNAYNCINKTIESAGFTTLKMHNQVLSMGEWGWILGSKNNTITNIQLKQAMRHLRFDDINTKWINTESMLLLTAFGKDSAFDLPDTTVEINQIHNPVLQKYYLEGNWDIY